MEIDYNKMQDAYNKMNEIIKDINENIKTIKKTVNKLNNNDEWNGNGYKSYNEKVNNLYSTATNYLDELRQLSNTLYVVILNYKQVDTAVTHASSSGEIHSGGGGSF